MRRRETLGFDMTPLVDVVFILVLFFIVSSVFKKEELALKLNLPSSNTAPIEIKKADITIELSKDKLAYLGANTTLKVLSQNLQNIKDAKKPITLRIDKDVTYQRVTKVLELLQEHGLSNLQLVTRKP